MKRPSRLHVLLMSLAAVIAACAAGAHGAGGGDPLPTFDVTITPNWLSPYDDPASNYQAVWIYPKSPTTPYRSPDSQKQVTRYMLLDPRSRTRTGARARTSGGS